MPTLHFFSLFYAVSTRKVLRCGRASDPGAMSSCEENQVQENIGCASSEVALDTSKSHKAVLLSYSR